MKLFLFLLTLISVSACNSCSREDEDFTPYPGGKYCQEKPEE